MRIHIIIAACITILAFVPVSVACTCGGMPSGNPACQAYWSADVIFSGKVLNVIPNGSGDSGPEYQVHFAIDEGFKEISARTAEVFTAQSSSACGYPFKVGESYMVYAHRRENGKLSVSLCGRTITMAGADADISYFRSMPTMKALGSISGIIHEFRELKANEVRQHLPYLSGVKVTAEGPNGKLQTTTDEAGKYSLIELKPGDYSLTIFAPEGYSPLKFERNVKVFAKRCSLYDYAFSRDPSTSVTTPK